MNVYLCKTNGRQLRTLSPGNLARIVSAQAAAASPISSRASIYGLPAPGPVLTFLSPNPQYSQSATQVLNQLFDFPTLYLNGVKGGEKMGRDGRARDHLDKLHFGNSSEANVMKWDSKACICPSSGTIIHLLSLSTNGDCETESHQSYHSQEVSSKHKLSLISVYGGGNPSDLLAETEAIQSTNEESYREVILEARKRLAKAMQSQQFFSSSESVGENEDSNSNSTSFASTLESRLRGLLFQFLHSIGKQAHGSLILSQNPLSSRPISTIIDLDSLQINGNRDELMQQIEFTVENSPPKSKLRELALPFFPEHSNFTAEFSRSSLLRPLPGLYQSYAMNSHLEQSTKDCPPKTRRNINSNPGLIFRPLPAATEDMRLPPPSLVFQCQSLTETQAFLEGTLGGRTAKIGWRGDGAGGSLMVFHPALSGIDIRISSGNENGDWILSSYFDEAQESLLAGSLDELQSAHVVSDGASKSDTQNELILERDSKIGNADCWMEVRANVKHPTGFWKQFSPGAMWNKITGKKKNTVNVAKPPDLPYD